MNKSSINTNTLRSMKTIEKEMLFRVNLTFEVLAAILDLLDDTNNTLFDDLKPDAAPEEMLDYVMEQIKLKYWINYHWLFKKIKHLKEVYLLQ